MGIGQVGLEGVGWGVEVGADALPPKPQPMGEKTNLGGGLSKAHDKGKENFKMSPSLHRMVFF